MPNLNLKVIMNTHFGQHCSQQFIPADFASLHQQIEDKLAELMQRVPVMEYPHDGDEYAALKSKMTQSFHDTARLRRDLDSAVDKFGEMLREIWDHNELPCFLEEPDTSKAFSWTNSWIFPIADEVMDEIDVCKRELIRSDEELSAAFWLLESDLGFEDLAEGGEFYVPYSEGAMQDNSKLREYRQKELSELCDKYAAAVQKMFDLATKARNDELDVMAAC